MDIDLIFKIALFVCSFVGFLYGAIIYLKKGKPLFNQLVVYGIGCFMFGRIYDLVYYGVSNEVTSVSSLGLLGIIGGFLFIFSASFGQMDGLVDGKEKKFLKYRLIALIAPIFIFSMLIPVFRKGNRSYIVVCILIFIFIMLAAYYNFKHLIIPDVDYGIIKSIRAYNIISLVLELIYAAQVAFFFTKVNIGYYIISTLLCICYVIIIPILKKGSSKWTI